MISYFHSTILLVIITKTGIKHPGGPQKLTRHPEFPENKKHTKKKSKTEIEARGEMLNFKVRVGIFLNDSYKRIKGGADGSGVDLKKGLSKPHQRKIRKTKKNEATLQHNRYGGLSYHLDFGWNKREREKPNGERRGEPLA